MVVCEDTLVDRPQVVSKDKEESSLAAANRSRGVDRSPKNIQRIGQVSLFSQNYEGDCEGNKGIGRAEMKDRQASEPLFKKRLRPWSSQVEGLKEHSEDSKGKNLMDRQIQLIEGFSKHKKPCFQFSKAISNEKEGSKRVESPPPAKSIPIETHLKLKQQKQPVQKEKAWREELEGLQIFFKRSNSKMPELHRYFKEDLKRILFEPLKNERDASTNLRNHFYRAITTLKSLLQSYPVAQALKERKAGTIVQKSPNSRGINHTTGPQNKLFQTPPEGKSQSFQTFKAERTISFWISRTY